jgi:hypothetical protein
MVDHAVYTAYLAMNGPSLSLSLSIAMVDHAVFTMLYLQHGRP